jgi:hypothetical protein
VERVCDAPLEVDRGCRFFHGGGVDAAGTPAIRSAVRDGAIHTEGGGGRDRAGTGRVLDDANCRNLTAGDDGIVNGKRYLIRGLDPLFTAEFLKMLADTGVQSVKLPPRSPNLNAHAERFVRTIKESCLDRMILFGEGSLRKAIMNFLSITIGSVTTSDWKPG